MKGETSGHVQELVEIRIDCDGDAVLYRVRQIGPACHTEARSCFFRKVEDDALTEAETPGHILGRIEGIVAQRQADPQPESYTTYLFAAGLDKILKKIGEETTEVVIAAKNGNSVELAAESADLLYHLLVLLRVRDMDLNDIWKVLEERFGKASRSRAAGQKTPTD